MTEDSEQKRGFFANWRFSSFFNWAKAAEQQTPSSLANTLHGLYPENTAQIVGFLAKLLRRREAIVERLSKYPELNDHGFFLVICKMYADTYHGIGYTNSRITNLIEIFSTSEISTGTAARKLQKANEVGVFITDRDQQDSRKQRYFLHPEMIEICNATFSGMLIDARDASAGKLAWDDDPHSEGPG